MNKYEQTFVDIISLFTDKGMWIQSEGCKIGVSWIEITDAGDNCFDFEEECNDCRYIYDKSISEFFEMMGDIRFSFSLNLALEGFFIDWEEFKYRVDNEAGFRDVLCI